MTIRRATLEDAGALTAFGRRVFAATFGSDNTPADLQSYLDHSYSDSRQPEELADPRLETLLAEVDATLAAFAQLREGPAGDGVNGLDSIELWRFYVDPRWHGQGLARDLMEAVEAAARDRGARTMWLGVWERNLRAQAFYRKHGFIVVGTQTFQLGSDAQRDLVMAKGL
jgi:ribosomal protein S18 acetylase RimI-like enzyme